MHIAIRLFVASVFVALAAAFIFLSGVLRHEFGNDWFVLAVFDSQLFLFFPLFGVVALIAFYRPTCVLVDIFWHHVAAGRWIILIALLVLLTLAWLLGGHLQSPAKALWDLRPEHLQDDRGENCPPPRVLAGEPHGCVGPSSGKQGGGRRCDTSRPRPGEPGSCKRLPFREALRNLRTESHARFGMSVFVRNCQPDKLVATPESEKEERYCFVNNQMQTAKNCCAAQAAFTEALKRQTEAAGESKTRTWYRKLLPFHVFYLLLILGIGISLVCSGKYLDLPAYAPVRSAVETRILAGAILMLFWPLLNHSFLQSADILYGNATDSTFRKLVPLITAMFGLWTLMLLFFFFRSFPERMKKVGQLAGVIGSVLAVFNFDKIVDALARMVGAGADQTTIGIVLLVVTLLIVLAIANRHLLTSDTGAGDSTDQEFTGRRHGTENPGHGDGAG